jgi:uncharacterized protein with von Willebrand factor type A (vWA) domain
LSTRQDRIRKDLKKTDAEIVRTDGIPQEMGSLRRTQDREDKVFSLCDVGVCNK